MIGRHQGQNKRPVEKPTTIYGLPFRRRWEFFWRQFENFFGATPDDRHRFWMHAPVGVVGALLTWWNAPIGITTTAFFAFYEAMQDLRKVDSSFKDIYGAAVTYGFTSVMIWWLLG